MGTTLHNNTDTRTLSQIITSEKEKAYSIEDDKGRLIILKKPTILSEMEFPLLLGEDRASNTMFFNRVVPLLYIDSLDGEKVPTFRTFIDVEYWIQKLGHEGMEALTVACAEYFFATSESTTKVRERLKIVCNGKIRECLWLIKNGIPFDVAFSLDDAYRSSWSIILSELETGRSFNFNTMKFDEAQNK